VQDWRDIASNKTRGDYIRSLKMSDWIEKSDKYSVSDYNTPRRVAGYVEDMTKEKITVEQGSESKVLVQHEELTLTVDDID
jgi:hypothetical protein